MKHNELEQARIDAKRASLAVDNALAHYQHVIEVHGESCSQAAQAWNVWMDALMVRRVADDRVLALVLEQRNKF